MTPSNEGARPSGWNLPELILDSRGWAEIEPPSHFARSAQIWRDHDGTVAAYGYMDGPTHTMILPLIGTFRFTAFGGDPVEVTTRPSVERDTLEDAYRRMVVPMVLQVRGLEVLHSSAALVRGKVVAFCGVCGSGKSTLAFAFSGRHEGLWADDAVAVDVGADVMSAIPLAFRLRLRPTSEAFFRDGPHQGRLGDAFRVATRSATSVPLRAVFTLTGASREAVARIRELLPAKAFPVLLEHAYCFSLSSPARKRQLVQNYLRLVQRIPVYEVRIPAGFEHMEGTIRSLSALAGPAGGG